MNKLKQKLEELPHVEKVDFTLLGRRNLAVTLKHRLSREKVSAIADKHGFSVSGGVTHWQLSQKKRGTLKRITGVTIQRHKVTSDAQFGELLEQPVIHISSSFQTLQPKTVEKLVALVRDLKNE